MGRNSKALRFFDFSGGLNSKAPITSLAYNQAIDLQNINLLPSGGFEKRRGNTAHNSSAMNSGANVQALLYYRQGDGDQWLVAFAGAKGFKSDDLDGTMDDITGAVTITAGQNNIWTSSVMNDLAIFVGGAPDAPLKWNGAGNLAALGGSPPSGNFGLTHNRRFFIGNTAALPSRIYWTVLGDPEDWSGTGSGSQDIQTGDGDTLVTASPLTVDHLICFKQNSIHDLITSTAPFPVFPLFKGVGCVGKHAKVAVDGLIYFITPQARMKATDGYKVYDFSDSIDDVWDGLNQSRLQYIVGAYNRRLHQIWWFCSNTTSTTNNYCIVYDVKRQAWLRNTTGQQMNVTTLHQNGAVYGGAYDGKIYQMDVVSTYTDASVTSPGAISAYWRTGWYDFETMLESKTLPYIEINIVSQTSGTFEIGYGFNFAQDRKILTGSMQALGGLWDQMLWDVGLWGGQTDNSKLFFTKGKGKFINFLLRNANPGEAFSFNGFEVPIKKDAVEALKTA